MAQDGLIRELTAAVERSPEVLSLRLHLAELLLQDGRATEALGHCGTALTRDPGNTDALALLQRCSAALSGPRAPADDFNWSAADEEVADIIGPAFIEGEELASAVGDEDYDAVQRSTARLDDVAGMPEVKTQLELSLLGPLRNPEPKARNVSGGLLLYGPPGCGRTFVARAVSGELGANFLPVGITDLLHHYFGDSEALHQIFETARRNAPCVLFFDEIDALGQRRSAAGLNPALRVVVNTLLAEMDSATSSNEGVYILGATDMPWDVDPALLRPGRFDRMIFVGLPDTEARTAIVRSHLRDRPVEGIDLGKIASRTDGLSGADLAHMCEAATQLAMAASLRNGQVRPVTMADIEAALTHIRPSTGPWFEAARNVVEFGNGDGTYDDLAKALWRK